MKKLKYTTSAILISLAMIIIGELYVWHISSFYSTFPSTTLYLQENQNINSLISDVQEASKSANIETFALTALSVGRYIPANTAAATGDPIKSVTPVITPEITAPGSAIP